MANILGQLLVELGINTAAWKSGLDAATYQTKAFGSEVQKTFKELGESTAALAGSFGVLGPAGLAITEALALAGGAAGKMIKEFSGVDKTLGVFAGAAGGVAAAALSVAGSTTALAVETSKSIKELGEQALMAGVNVTELSRLAYAGNLVGVSQETLVKGLERMNKGAFAAAEGNKQMQAAFHAVLGDGAVFNDVITKGHVSLEQLADGFAKIKDPQEKSALAMQLLGRGGAALIPILNQGGNALRALGAESDALGTTITGELLENSEKFQQNLTRIKAAGSGVAVQITSELLPTLNTFAQSIVADLKSPDSNLKALVDGLVTVTKAVYTIGDAFVTIAETVGKALGGITALAVEEATTLAKVGTDALHLDWKGAESDAKEGAHRIATVMDTEIKSISDDWRKFGQTASAMWSKGTKEGTTKEEAAPGAGAPIGKIGGLAGAATTDPVKKMLAEVQEQIKSEIELIGIIDKGKVAYEVQKAEMAERKKLAQEQLTLETELTGLRAKRVEAGESGAPAATAQIDKQIAETQRRLAELKAGSATAIAGAGIASLGSQVGATGTGLAQLLSDQRTELSNMEALNAAILEGGAALASAQAEQKFRKQTEAIQQQRAALAALVPMNDNERNAIAALTAELDRQQALLKKAIENQEAIASEEITKKILDTTKAIQTQAATFDILAAAANRGAAAEREAAAAAAITGFRAANPGASGAQLAAVGANAAAEFDLKQRESDQQHINAVNQILSGYRDQYETLGRMMALAGENTDQQRVISNLIADQNRLWDEQALKYGNFTQQVAAFFDDLSQKGRNLGAQIAADLMGAIDQFNSSLSKSLVTGKGMDWRKLLGGMDTSLVNTGLKFGEGFLAKGVSGLFGNSGVGSMLGGLLGASQKRDGSSSAMALYVQEVNPLASGVTGAASAAGDLTNMSWLKSLGGLIPGFGGFLAEGGDVTDGKAYVVGEEHPEYFIPGRSGMIAPVLKTSGGDTHITNVAFHGVTDHDSFKRNQTQVMNHIALQAAKANGRR